MSIATHTPILAKFAIRKGGAVQRGTVEVPADLEPKEMPFAAIVQLRELGLLKDEDDLCMVIRRTGIESGFDVEQ